MANMANMANMAEKPDSSLARMLGVLDLFTEKQLTWTAEEISAALQVSLTTGYRYVRLLTDAGLLQRTAESQYTLGPRIMVLDHYMRQADPVLQQAIAFMKELVKLTSLDCVISGYHGHQILDTHHELGSAPPSLSYGRGRPRPLFRGAAPKVILASLVPTQLRRVFDANHADIVAAGLPLDWTGFRKHYAAVRSAGYYISMGEVDQSVAAMAVPLGHIGGGVHGALTLVTSIDHMRLMDQARLLHKLQRAASDITSRI